MKVGDLIRNPRAGALWVVVEVSKGKKWREDGYDILVMSTKTGYKMWSSSDYCWKIVNGS